MLVVSHGPFPAITRRENRTVMWVCLYLYRDGGSGHVLSAEAQRLLRERKLDVQAHSDFARIIDRREYQVKGARLIKEATAPERLAELWRLTGG